MEAIIIIAVFWLVLQLIGGTAGKAARRAIDDAETPAEVAAAAGAGCGALLLLAAVALLALAAAIGSLAPAP